MLFLAEDGYQMTTAKKHHTTKGKVVSVTRKTSKNGRKRDTHKTPKKVVYKKSGAYRVASKGQLAVVKKSAAKAVDSGFVRSVQNLYLPHDLATVKPSKLAAGIKTASSDIQNLIGEIVRVFGKNASVSEINLSVGFNAEGKFLGIGIGGDVNLSVKINPNN